MKRLKYLLFLTPFLIMSSCGDFFMICSLNPFYIKKNITLAESLNGNWTVKQVKKSLSNSDTPNYLWKIADTTSVWNIERSKTREKNEKGYEEDFEYYYTVKLIGNFPDSALYQFKLVVFVIDGVIYGDFTPFSNSAIESSQMAKDHYLFTHSVARIDGIGDNWSLTWLGYETVKQMIGKRANIKYKWISDQNRLILSGSSNELTNMIERYGTNKRYIDWEYQPCILKMNRIKK